MRAAGAEPSSLKSSAKWLRSAQNADGGWGLRPKALSESDSSGAAVQGLIAAGASGKSASAGARWLQRAQQHGGGWALGGSGVINSQSTAWAIQGLVAAGAGADSVEKGQRYLAGLRAPDGHYRYSAQSDQTAIWVTGQVIVAAEGKAFPLAAVARKPKPSPQPDSERDGGGSSQGPAREDGGSKPATHQEGTGDSRDGGHDRIDKPDKPAESTPAESASASTEAPTNPSTTDTDSTNFVPLDAGLVAPPPEQDDDSSTLPWLIVGFTALAAALGGGFVWYRRRLP
jgi:hypothetical protein